MLSPTLIGKWAEENGLAMHKPTSINHPFFLEYLRSLDLDVILVFSYGQILSEQVLSIPKFGCINIHTSLLPKYRGASPICAAIMAGDMDTGISIMQMEKGLDSGPVYHQFKLRIGNNIYAHELELQLANLAADKICNSIATITNKKLKPVEQSATNISFAKKISKKDGFVIWSNDAERIERQVRAYSNWPGAWFFLEMPNRSRKKITIAAASVHKCNVQLNHPPGTIIQADKFGWKIACGKNALSINKLIPEGKREMTFEEYLRGNPITIESKI